MLRGRTASAQQAGIVRSQPLHARLAWTTAVKMQKQRYCGAMSCPAQA